MNINANQIIAVSAIILPCLLGIAWKFIDYATGVSKDHGIQMMRKLDDIACEQKAMKDKIEPLVLEIAKHNEKFSTIEKMLDNQKGWLDAHDDWLIKLERTKIDK